MVNLSSVLDGNKAPYTMSDYFLIVFTRLMGCLSLIAMMVFFFVGSLNLVKLEVGESGVLLLNSFLSIGFFIQHSGMIRKSFERWSAQFIDKKYQGALFTISSSIALLLLVVFWQKSSYTLFSAHDGLRWILRAVYVTSVLGSFWAIRSLGSFNLFGLDPILQGIKGATARPSRLRVRGAYRWVRHPLYLFCLLMIWSCPDLTADRLLFNLLWTAWILVGTILEERDLVKLFGEDYRVYQSEVPMLIPTRIPSR
jgi:protein-S-isoprenylcysteine O-methyltransferase Ste14